MYNIKTIEALTEEEAKRLAIESATIKNHNIYFVDFEGAFGYSVLVYKNSHHIHYANDYALHHPNRTKEFLHDYYIESLNHKLFTEEEIVEPLKDYDDYTAKSHYLHNYYHMQKDYISAFRIVTNETEEKAFAKEIENMHYNPISFCYMHDKDFIAHQAELYNALQKAKNATADNFEYYVEAFRREMYNHEYCINWDADIDTLSAFGHLRSRFNEPEPTLNDLFDELNFTKTQRNAYLTARQRYFKEIRESDYA